MPGISADMQVRQAWHPTQETHKPTGPDREVMLPTATCAARINRHDEDPCAHPLPMCSHHTMQGKEPLKRSPPAQLFQGVLGLALMPRDCHEL